MGKKQKRQHLQLEKPYFEHYNPQPPRQWRVTWRQAIAGLPYLALALLFSIVFAYPNALPIAAGQLAYIYAGQFYMFFILILFEPRKEYSRKHGGRIWVRRPTWFPIIILAPLAAIPVVGTVLRSPAAIITLLSALFFIACRFVSLWVTRVPRQEYDYAHHRRSMATVLLLVLSCVPAIPCGYLMAAGDGLFILVTLNIFFYLLFAFSESIGHVWIDGNGFWGSGGAL